MASIAATSPPAPRNQFEKAMESLDLDKQQLNALVMDYFINEGYLAAAARFAEEANIELKEDDADPERVTIKNAIYRGDIQTAIEEINELSPQILDGDKPLHFAVLRLQLIELIKETYTATEIDRPRVFGEAIKFAQENLAPYAPQNDRFKHDLERAMALMIVPKEAMQTAKARAENVGAFGQLYELVDQSLRIKVADEVNSAILRHKGKPDRSRIHNLLQTRAWSEDLAREKGIDIPEDMTVSLEDPPVRSENGHGDTGDTQMTEAIDEDGGGDPVSRYTHIP